MSQGKANPDFSAARSRKVMPMLNGDYGAADEGSFFVASCVDTANTDATDTLAKAGTNPNLVIQNKWAAGSGYNLYLRYIKIKVGTIITGGSAGANYGMWLSNNAAKLTTAATVVTPYKVNSGGTVNPKAYLSFGANTTIAPASDAQGWLVGGAAFTQAVTVVLDVYTFAFGEPMAGSSYSVSTVGARSIAMPPVIVAPQQFFCFGTWAGSYSGASSFAWEVGFIERPAGQ